MSRILFACVALTLAACADPKDLNGDGIVDATESGRSPDTAPPFFNVHTIIRHHHPSIRQT